ncbi:hypothetical protein MKQ68_15500 [Chitinophaga horti]|uniref:Uncharacterized protein n=1 Tax=Chitinophaga horti TaxID=2920382 RepID=A0ABY6IW29_9BACT|nr:hypothetical protein [Chitinophaga horti]UYQ91495.1 hypothetical protein MKQ68_15500 [Chitinophaga horti]
MRQYTTGYRPNYGIAPLKRDLYYLKFDHYGDLFPEYKERFGLYRIHIANADRHVDMHENKDGRGYYDRYYFFYAE